MDIEKVIKTLKDRIRDCSMIGDGFDVTINWKLADEILAILKEQDNEIDTLRTLLFGYETGAIKGNN